MGAKIKGQLVTLNVSSDGGTTKNKIGSLKGASLAIKTSTIDATTNDSAGWDESLPGNSNWTISADGLLVDDDAGQGDVFDALTGKTALYIEFMPQVGAGTRVYTGTAYITSFSEDHSQSDLAAVKIEMQGTGELTKATQPVV